MCIVYCVVHGTHCSQICTSENYLFKFRIRVPHYVSVNSCLDRATCKICMLWIIVNDELNVLCELNPLFICESNVTLIPIYIYLFYFHTYNACEIRLASSTWNENINRNVNMNWECYWIYLLINSFWRKADSRICIDLEFH